jgi:hypothetical protein
VGGFYSTACPTLPPLKPEARVLFDLVPAKHRPRTHRGIVDENVALAELIGHELCKSLSAFRLNEVKRVVDYSAAACSLQLFGCGGAEVGVSASRWPLRGAGGDFRGSHLYSRGKSVAGGRGARELPARQDGGQSGFSC